MTGADLGGILIYRDGPATIYTQLCEQLRSIIQDGSLPQGVRMPATRVFAEELGISRTTAREVYDQLGAEGYLSARIGRGTFVSSNAAALQSLQKRSQAAKAEPAVIETDALSQCLSTRALDFFNSQLGDISPRPIPFNPSLPDFHMFPFNKWNRIVKRSLRYNDAAMGYGYTAGYQPLREAVAHYLRLSRGVDCQAAQVIITASSEQAIRRIAFLLLDTQACVWCGDPGIYSRRNAFRTAGVETRTVQVDNEGVVVEQAYAFDRHTRLAYVMPWRHYPLGITMSLTRRLELLEWARQYDGWIIEDDFGSEFSFMEKPPPPLQSLDVEKRTIFIGSFGLSLFPALRLTYVVLPSALVEPMQNIDRVERSVSGVLQPALAEFISDGHLTAHIRKMRKVYRQREQFLARYLKNRLGDEISISGRGGGSNFILNLPDDIDESRLSAALEKQGVIAFPMSDYYLEMDRSITPYNALNLGFTSASIESLERSAEILVKTFLALKRPGL